MFKSFLLLLITLGSSILTTAQVWPKYYGQANRKESVEDIIQAYDGGYLILGNYRTNSVRFGWLIKTDVNGNVLWERVIQGKYDLARAVVETKDGGVVICGGTTLFNDYSDPFILKLNACGEIVWCKSFWVPLQGSHAMDIKETKSGDLVMIFLNYGQMPEEMLHLCKMDSAGEVIWIKAYCREQDYPESSTKVGKSLLITDDEDYLITGYVYWENPWGPQYLVYTRAMFVMVDSSGAEEWILPFGLNDTIVGGAYGKTIEIEPGVFIGVGDKWESQSEGHPLFMKFDKFGNELDHFVVESSDIDSNLIQGALNSIQINDNIYSFIGSFESDIPGYSGIVLDMTTYTNIFSSGFAVKNKRINLTMGPYTSTHTNDNKILSGSTQWGTDWTIYLAKMNLNLEFDTLDSGNYTYDSLCPYTINSGFISLNDCYVVNSEEELPTPEEYYAAKQRVKITPFPNPAADYITFSLENTSYHSEMKLEYYDIIGHKVYESKLPHQSSQTSLSLSSWQNGLYIALVISKGKVVGKCRFLVVK